MKRLMTIGLLAVALSATAKDLHTLVVKTSMHCENCTKRIREKVRFEKGVKSIKPDLEAKTVTVIYDADKGKQQAIVKAISALGYETAVISDKKVEGKQNPEADAATAASPQQK